VGPGPLGQLGRRDPCAVGHGPIEPQAIADHGHRHVQRGADLVDDALEERHHPGLVDGRFD
jgi:hypothetical protein